MKATDAILPPIIAMMLGGLGQSRGRRKGGKNDEYTNECVRNV